MTLGFQLQQNHGGWNNNDKQTNNISFRIGVTDSEALPARYSGSDQGHSGTPAEARSPAARRAVQLLARERARIPRGEQPDRWPLAGAPRGRVPARAPAARNTSRDAPARPATSEPARGRGTRDTGFPPPDGPGRRARPPRLCAVAGVAGSPHDRARLRQPRLAALLWRGHLATTDDLGMQGEPPAHPELLDWLAATFMESGWNVKDLHRRIVHSATYRQESTVTALLARAPTTACSRAGRASAWRETVRDIALAARALTCGHRRAERISTAPRDIFLPPPATDQDLGLRRGARTSTRAHTFRFRSVPFRRSRCSTPSGEAPCTRRERSNSRCRP